MAASIETETSRGISRGARFCLWFVLFTALGFGLPLWWGHSKSYITNTDAVDHGMVLFPETLNGKNYDFVIFGDSSGLFGIDPRIVQREIGRPVVNLCVTRNVLALSGTQPLDDYLARHARPKAIVLAISASDDNPADMSSAPYTYDAALYALQHGPPRAFLRLAIHPAPLLNLWNNIVGRLFRPGPGNSWIGKFVDGQGHVPYPAMRHPDTCTGDPGPRSPMTHRFVNPFAAKYRAEGIPVLIYIMPTSDCNRYFSSYKAALRNIADNTPYQIPHTEMQNDHSDHAFPEQVPEISENLARTIEERLPQLCGRSMGAATAVSN